MTPEPCAVSLHPQSAPLLSGVRSGIWFVVYVLEEVIWSISLVLHLTLLMQVLTPNQRPARGDCLRAPQTSLSLPHKLVSRHVWPCQAFVGD